MQSTERAHEETSTAVHTPAEVADVQQALGRILESQPFRTSRQCRDLLRYIVEHSLAGQDSHLRERTLGVEVFGRTPDYDTAEDPVVRMRAADVRKRLAQFYQSVEPQHLHIELKPGSYRAAFRFSPELKTEAASVFAQQLTPIPVRSAAAPGFDSLSLIVPASAESTATKPNVAAERSRGRRLSLVLAAMAAVVLATAFIAAARLWRAPAETAQFRFWAPLFLSKGPVLLYLGSNVAYRFSPNYMQRYQQQHGMQAQNGPEFFPDLPPGAIIHSEDLLQMKDTFITTGDLAASVEVASLLTSWTRPLVLRSAADLSIGDLRNRPAVLIGGFNNHWALEATDQLPLTFREGVSIVDRRPGGQRWVIDPNDHHDTTQDFALISRVLKSNTGGPALILGGIGSYGTQAAAEFVCSPEKMNELLRTAPPGWEGKNMQAVLRIQVVGYTPVSLEVAKAYFW